MSHDLRGREHWVGANGKIITIEGKKYKIKVSSYKAIYPYERMVISVYAEMMDKADPEYLDTKLILGDDWSTDVLDSGDDFYAAVYLQLFPEKFRKFEVKFEDDHIIEFSSYENSASDYAEWRSDLGNHGKIISLNDIGPGSFNEVAEF